MNTKLKKIISALLAVLMFSVIFTMTASAGSSVTYHFDSGVDFEFSGATLFITGSGYIPDMPSYRPWDGLSENGVSVAGSVKTIIISSGITYIGENSLSGFVNLENIIFESSTARSVEKPLTIGEWSITSCPSLKEIVFPDRTVSLGEGAFSSCTSLERVSFGSKFETISGSKLDTFNGCPLKEFNVSETNEKFTSVDGVLYSKDMTTLILYPSAKNGEVYTLPESVLKIETFAFGKTTNLLRLVFPNPDIVLADMAITEIGTLNQLQAPDSCTTVKDYVKEHNMIYVNENGEMTDSCICHRDGFIGFFYKIIRLFWMLFKMNPTCECGAAHY